MSDLTSHPLVPVGSLWRTADATGMVYNPTTSVVTDRDGIQYTLGFIHQGPERQYNFPQRIHGNVDGHPRSDVSARPDYYRDFRMHRTIADN